ncbi:MAG: branched-chain amino acid ABC transporter permease [Alphaproteobacteria bacterium]|nr:branched-chain amino acid ABC transporter permease [Alphaproteobacteria bacterium]
MTSSSTPGGTLLALLPWLVALAIAAAVPLFLPIYMQRVAVTCLMFVTLGVSWNLSGGFAGQLSLGQAAFFGIGAYGSMITAEHVTSDLLTSIVVGGIVAGLCTPILFPAFRLRGIYLGMATFALGESMRVVAEKVFPGEASGLHTPVVFAVDSLAPYYWALGIAAFTIAVGAWTIRSRLGLGLMTVREDDQAARSIGVPVALYKAIVFAIGAFATGLAGGFYARYLGFIDPHSVFHLDHSINPVFVTIIGGIGTELGPIVGAIFWVILQEVLRGLTDTPAVNTIIYGLLLLVVILVVPRGIVGESQAIWRRIADRRRGRRTGKEIPVVAD